MSAMQGRAAKAMAQMAYVKFAATVDMAGVPNVVPLLSARLLDPQTIAFVKFMVWKTARNFEANKKITIACRGPKGRSYLARGEFAEWVTSGPLLERFEEEAMYRYNAYMGANVVGLINVKDVLELPGSGALRPLLAALLRRKLGAVSKGPMAAQVIEKWGRAAGIKFLGLVDGGEPLAIPAQGLFARDAATLVFPMPKGADHPLHRLAIGAPLAASVLCLDPVAYQVKGKFGGLEGADQSRGRLEVAEVYSASPPVPGKRLYPREE